MTSTASPAGLRKAAVFLMSVGESVSAELLKQLTPDEVRLISSEIAATESIGSVQMLSVFQEFESLIFEGRYFAKGGADCARRLVETAFGADSAQKLLGAPRKDPAKPEPKVLESADPQQLAQLLSAEHPQTIAVVLSGISTQSAAALLGSLPAPARAQVALRMARMGRVSPEAFEKITEALGSRILPVSASERPDGVHTLAAVLNRMDEEHSAQVLAAVESLSAPIADSVRGLMFVFDDIVKIDNQGMTVLAGKVDRKALAVALKGCSSKLREHFTKCMSQRAAEMLAEDMEALGPVRIRDVEEAQKAIITQIREMQQRGQLAISRGDGDEYVV
jgi:flagellar motor switch protein FliG